MAGINKKKKQEKKNTCIYIPYNLVNREPLFGGQTITFSSVRSNRYD